jgi:hypothetical protein
MPRFSEASKEKLATCHPDLQTLFNKVIQYYDCTVICGHRTQEEQDYLYPAFTRLKWPNSKHNSTPSLAVDVAPYPIDWNDAKRFYHFAGFVYGVADMMGIDIRWGGDWDSDFEFGDQTFHDLPHYELRVNGARVNDVEV